MSVHFPGNITNCFVDCKCVKKTVRLIILSSSLTLTFLAAFWSWFLFCTHPQIQLCLLRGAPGDGGTSRWLPPPGSPSRSSGTFSSLISPSTTLLPGPPRHLHQCTFSQPPSHHQTNPPWTTTTTTKKSNAKLALSFFYGCNVKKLLLRFCR